MLVVLASTQSFRGGGLSSLEACLASTLRFGVKRNMDLESTCMYFASDMASMAEAQTNEAGRRYNPYKRSMHDSGAQTTHTCTPAATAVAIPGGATLGAS